MATLGKTSDGTTTSTATTAKTIVSSATASASGVLATGSGRIACSAGTVSVQMVVYADSSGSPGARLAVSDALSVDTNLVEKEFTFSGANLINIVNGTTYWIGFSWALPGVTMSWRRDGTAAQVKSINSQTPDPFGTASDLNGPLAAYIEFFAAAPTNNGGFFAFF